MRLHLAILLLVLLSGGGLAKGSRIGIVGTNSDSEIASFLSGHGHSVTRFGASAPLSYTNFDLVLLLRTTPSGGASTALKSFVISGGRLITEWDASVWALNVAQLLSATDAGGGPVAAATPVTFTTAGIAEGLAADMNNPYADPDRTEYFRTFSSIGPGADILATRPGGVAAILGGRSGDGSTLVIGYDWADNFSSANDDTQTLLLNAINFPEPALLPLAIVMTYLAGRRPRRLSFKCPSVAGSAG